MSTPIQMPSNQMQGIQVCQQCHGKSNVLTQNARRAPVQDCPACQGTGHNLTQCGCQRCQGIRQQQHRGHNQ